MDLFKALTGKNPSEYELAARKLVDESNIELFQQLVSQEEFLFDFVKKNVAKRIKEACNKDNYKNLLSFLDYYSPSYDDVIAEVLYSFGGEELFNELENSFLMGIDSRKAYLTKFLLHLPSNVSTKYLEFLREDSHKDNEYLANNSIEVLSKLNDKVSKNEAIDKLNSKDEFEQYNAVKFLVTYGAKDTLPEIIKIMKTSSLSENIALEIPFLVDIDSILETSPDDAVLVLCNIVNAIGEIIPLYSVIDYNLLEIFENLYYNNLTSSSALLLRMAKTKFASFEENEEYLFDSDKNTKQEISNINKFLSSINENKLNSLLYDELYEESDFVFFAVDYVNDIEELETLLDSNNQTLLLKVLTVLKEKHALKNSHKEIALNHITSDGIKQIINVL